MRNATEKVLFDLQKVPSGVTINEYAKGFRLGARIYDLRKVGYDIATIREYTHKSTYIARYVLLNKQPKGLKI